MTGLIMLGLDLSLTSTGLVWSGPAGFGARTVASPRRGHERLDDILRAVATAAACRPHLAVIEVLPVISAGRGDSQQPLAGLHWMVRHWLWLHQVPYVLVHPAQLKQYVTGHGAADKVEVLIAMQQLLQTHGLLLRSQDEADAAGLLAMALHHYGQPLVPSTRRHHAEALAKVDWPDLAAREPEGATA